MGNKHAKSRKQAKVAIAPQFEKTEQVCLAAVEKCVEGNQGKADTSPEQSDEVGGNVLNPSGMRTFLTTELVHAGQSSLQEKKSSTQPGEQQRHGSTPKDNKDETSVEKISKGKTAVRNAKQPTQPGIDSISPSPNIKQGQQQQWCQEEQKGSEKMTKLKDESIADTALIPPGVSLVATDGYISFSESGSEAASLSGAEPPSKFNDSLEVRQEEFNQKGSDEGSRDKWDFGDDSTEDEGGAILTGNTLANGEGLSFGGESVVTSGGSKSIGSGVKIDILEEPLVKVDIDRLGRRKQDSRRASSSSSSGQFDGWGDETEEEEEEEEDDDDDDGDGSVYDWTTMDTREGEPELESLKDSRTTPASLSESKPATIARAKAEANPLASKLGLTTGVSRPTTSVINAVAPRGAPQLRGPGHGPGRGRFGKAVVPGRGGRPLYYPLTKDSSQDLRQHARPPPSISRVGATFDGSGNPKIPNGGSTTGGGGPTTLGRTPGAPPSTGTTYTSPGPSVTGMRGESSVAGAGGSIGTPTNSAAASTATGMMISPILPHRIHTVPGRGGGGVRSGAAGSVASGMPLAAATAVNVGSGNPGSRQAIPAHGGRGSGSPAVEGSAVVHASAGRIATGTSRPISSGADGTGTHAGGGQTASTMPAEELGVKDTANITRKKAQLPQQEQLEHPTPVGGSWLKNRYIVNNFILLEPLGTGSYAEVRLAKEKTSNKLYAVKIMNKDFLKKRQVGKEGTFMDGIEREIAIMKKVHHPNVLCLYEVMDDPKVNKLYLVLEYCKKGDLMNILNGDMRTVTCDPMNDADVWYIMRQIVQGLRFLHMQNIVHGDIKPQNLLVGSDNVAKIADFGISKFVQGSQRLEEQVGTPTFMSPELCSGDSYSGQLADVWALGATMYMIRCGKPPFMAAQVMALYEKIQNDPLEFPPEVNMSPGLKRLLMAMMEKEPSKRATLDQVSSDRWLQQGENGLSYATAATTISPPSGPRPNIAPPAGVPPNTNAGPLRNSTVAELGLRAPPPLSALPLNQQGYLAISVSEDEVNQSINRGTTVCGPLTPAESESGAGTSAGIGKKQHHGSPIQQRAAPSIPERTAYSPSTSAIAQHLGGVARYLDIARGQLSEVEESRKFSSFKKKTEGGGSDPKFRGATISGSGVEHLHGQKADAHERMHASTSSGNGAAAKEAAGSPTTTTLIPPHSSGETESDRDDSDEFSSDDPDTLFERGWGFSPGASPQSSDASPRGGEAGVGVGGRGVTFEKQGSGGGGRSATSASQVERRATRRSDEKFDAVMDTLAAQPRCKGGTSKLAKSSSGGVSRPLRDLSLQGVAVASSSELCNSRLGLVAAVSQRQGSRGSQEDRAIILPDVSLALVGKVDRPFLYQQFGLFGVFDGHNGQMCSEALSTGLHIAVAKQPTFQHAPEKALIQAFNTFDRELCASQEKEGDASGSTALVVLFNGRSRGLLVANVGDSRCVASMAGLAARLSADHRLSRPDELERVTASGGFVANNRINNMLAISRSFGDVQHKETRSPCLIATPEISSKNVTSTGVEFVILATDGLWDVIDDQEAVNFVRLRLSENGDLSAAAKGLTKLALDEGSVDNVTAVLVWFNDNSVGEGTQQHADVTNPRLPSSRPHVPPR